MHDRMPRVFAIGMTPVQPRKVSSTSRTYTHHDQKEHTKQHGARPFYLDKKRTNRGEDDPTRHVPGTAHA